MPLDSLDRHLGFLLHDVARLLRKRFEQKAREVGLTRAQWQVLAHLARREGIHQGGLADILDIEPITLVRILDRLEAASLVERRSHATDRRLRLLYLTPKAHPLLEQIWRLGAETREEALSGIAAADREQLMATLLAMKANLIQTSAPVAAPAQPQDHD